MIQPSGAASTTSAPVRDGLGRPRADAVVERFDSWPYAEALLWMQERWGRVVDGGPMVIGVGCHDPAVVTLGRHAPETQIVDAEALTAAGIEVVRTDRGGGATLHQPGQLVLYPVVNLRVLKWSVPAFTDALLEAAIQVLADAGIDGERVEGLPGVYVQGRKIASVGFRWRRGVVTHGLSLNVDNDLGQYAHIHACGEADREPTSIAAELARRDPSGGATAREHQHETREPRRQWNRLVERFAEIAMLRCLP